MKELLLLGFALSCGLWQFSEAQCPSGVPVYNCLVDPCTGRSCPAFPGATCRSNYCGGCNFDFFLKDNTNVTARCVHKQCPVVNSTTGFGTCLSTCGASFPSHPCRSDQMCCSNGCGFFCTTPVTVCRDRSNRTRQVGESFQDDCNTCTCLSSGAIACTEIGCQGNLMCPPSSGGGGFGICQVLCHNDSECSNGQLCCGSCPRQCVDAIRVPVCNVSGTLYQVNQTFPAADGCNNCSCTSSGQVLCSRRACLDPCSEEPDVNPGDCLLPTPPRYYYDVKFQVCRQYTRGCGANSRNDFTTAGDCYARCRPRSVCNAPVYPGGTSPPCDVVGRRYMFSGQRGACVNLTYYLCGEESEHFNVFRSYQDCYHTCVSPPTTPTTPNCSAGSVRCLTNPCSNSFCPNFPNATCNASNCGRCSAHYFLNGQNVTNRCHNATPTCSDGSPIVICDLDPCDSASCPAVPGARCVSTNCSRCSFTFLNQFGADVTRLCNNSLPLPARQPVCPNMASSGLGVCSNVCRSDTGCSASGQLCCPTSCGGRVCVQGDLVPYYPVPPTCPTPTSRTALTSNCSSAQSCRSDGSCPFGQLCCNIGCGRVCVAGQFSQSCAVVLGEIRAAGIHPPPGYYTPMCASDSSGKFNATQCTEGLCWCVDINSGRPVSSYYPRGVFPQCQSCSYNSRRYAVGETFPASDGCNQCTCRAGGVVECSLRPCPLNICSLPPATGRCRAAFPAYFFNSTSQKCERFTYGGCDGNENRFQTVEDCLNRCSNRSVCLLDAEPGLCQAYFSSYFFNRTSNLCETFTYGGCGGNGNRFASQKACTRSCDPDAPVLLDCSLVLCAQPVCSDNYVQTLDPSRCCPYCRPVSCNLETHFVCSNGTCISRDRRCDRIRDCRDNSDEENCDSLECEFRCSSGECIRRSRVCDRNGDCMDNSDETNCSRPFTDVQALTADIATQCPAPQDGFCRTTSTCSSHRECLGAGQICCNVSCGGRSCVDGDPLSCRVIRSRQLNSGLLGAFTPSCNSDGTFNRTQCHELYCWCVESATGRPTSDGRRIPDSPQCEEQRCTGRNNEMLDIGESQRLPDGCNSCTCTAERLICSRRKCRDASCTFGGQTIRSGNTGLDDCNTCACSGGNLNCTRKSCPGFVAAQVMAPKVKMTMPFQGDYNSITNKENFKREVKKTLLDYEGSGFTEDQIEKIEVRAGSIIVEVTITDSTSLSSGANTTILVAQIEQDYNDGVLVIRYDGQVLVPEGEFQYESVSESSTTEVVGGGAAGGLQDWHIAIIVVVLVVLALAVVVIIAAAVMVVMKKPSSSRSAVYMSSVTNDYDDSKLPLD